MKTLGDIGAGNTLGRYDLLTPLAQGGMAIVWAARLRGSRGFQKIVAVKAMLPSLAEDSSFEEMFIAEAELSARIKHPNVCEIFDVGEEDGTPYIVMEWVNGEPLSALSKAARAKGLTIPVSVAARIVHEAALGLHAAHEVKGEDGALLGLVHRDVSPQNILIGYDGIVKVVDFGIAKATNASDEKKTQAGQVKGKVQYMAPEQAAGKADRRSDIFALGIVAYILVTGKHPFEADNDMAMLRKICSPGRVPAASTLAQNLPLALDQAISRALDKDPKKRFQTMAEFASALELAKQQIARRGEEKDVAAFVGEVLAERSEKRKRMIKEAIRLADSRATERHAEITGASKITSLDATSPSNPSMASPPMGTSTWTDSRPGVPAGAPPPPESDAGVSTPIAPEPLSSAAPPTRRRTWLVVGGVAAAVAVAVTLLVTLGGGKPAPATAASPPPSATPTPKVTVAEPTATPREPAAPRVESSASAAPIASASATPQPSARPVMNGAVAPQRPTPAPSYAGPAVNVPKIRDPGF